RIAEAFDCRVQTVENVRQRLVCQGFDAALDRRAPGKPPRGPGLGGGQEAKGVGFGAWPAPGGEAEWVPLRLVAPGGGGGHGGAGKPGDAAKDAKKKGVTGRKVQYWVIPPKANSEFVAAMENVLETYAQPYDPRFPVLTMDEQPVQLLRETRQPVPATRDRPRRGGYEYERGRAARGVGFARPLSRGRGVGVRAQRAKGGWGVEGAGPVGSGDANA